MKPIIGISISKLIYNSPSYAYPYTIDFVARNISQAVIQAGGTPILLPIADKETAKSYAQIIDGLILSGGSDVAPQYYGQTAHRLIKSTMPSRDISEYALTQATIDLHKPILGICRGFQFLNVVFGGDLYQDLRLNEAFYVKHIQDSNMEYPIHPVEITSGSYFEKVVQQASIVVNSHHHQAIKDLGDEFSASGLAPDGLIEVIEKVDDQASILAVQWHPEEMYQEYPEQMAIFQDIVKRAQERKDAKL